MSEFTEKLRSSELIWNAVNEVDKDQADVGFLIEIIRNEFKDWQPPKPLVVVPQFVAVWFEDKMLGSFSAVVASYSFSDDEAITWVHDNGGLDLLCKMKLYGYTVKKEQLYVLELPRQYNPYVSQVNDFNVITRFAPLFYEAKRLSESEIKAIDERYWAFAVKVEEVEP